MTCVTHPERESTAFCRTCGRAMCAECKRDVRGVIYCETCLARELAGAAQAPGGAFAPSAGPNPGVALGLGFIPGVGAIYNGQYAKAFVHVILFGVLISVVDNPGVRGFEPLFGLMIPAFIAYMAFEAFHTAKKRQGGQAVDEWSGLASGNSAVGRSGGAIFMIVLGILFS